MNKSEKIVYEAFYKTYKMPDKLLYIKKVLQSCKTSEQLYKVKEWGRHILEMYRLDFSNKAMNKYGMLRCIEMDNEFSKRYLTLLREIDCYSLKWH